VRTRMTALAIVIAALGGASIAEAHSTTYRTTSSFAFGAVPEAALGFINDGVGNQDCRKGRIVKLYRVRSGRDLLLGRDRSGTPVGNGDGHWTVHANLGNARYYARIKQKNIGTGAHRHICRAYRTSTLRYHP